MARYAGICGIEEWTDALAMAEVRAFVDRGGDDRCDVSELQMFFVAEFFERGSLSAESCDG
jgi:hypothetical protein